MCVVAEGRSRFVSFVVKQLSNNHGKLDVGTTPTNWRKSVLYQAWTYSQWHSEVAWTFTRSFWESDGLWHTNGA